jgi:glycosyltransferase involved in cell wall biosynthesis
MSQAETLAALTADKTMQSRAYRRTQVRIAFLISRADEIGGAHIHVRDLSTALRARGVDAIVLTGGQGALVDQLRERRVPVHCLRHLRRAVGPIRAIGALLEIRRLLRELRPELVSTHSTTAGLLGRIAARSLGIPVLFTAHGWGFTEGRPWSQRIAFWLAEWAAAPLAARIITVCESDLQAATRGRLTRRSRLLAIPNAMPDVKDSLRAAPDRSPPRIVMVARLSSWKDHPTLLHALAQLVDIEWELELVGDGPLRQDVELLAASLNIASRVRFAGFRVDVAERLADAQLFVLATRWEGFPRSILEAMRAGLPVIASDVGGVRESVRVGETGFIVPAGDVDALRDHLKLLLINPAQRLQMGTAGRMWYESRFSLDRLLAETAAVYETVLAEAEGGPDGRTRFSHP